MKWAVIDDGRVTNIYEGPEPPEGSVAIPDGLNPFRLSWDGTTLSEMEQDLSEIEAANRDARTTRLSASDWTQLPDATADKAAWATYRQALRDLTDHVNWPNLSEADWPSPPED